MKNYKLLAVDGDGKACNVDLRQLIEYITSEVLKQIPNSHVLTSSNDWMAREDLYFKYKKSIDTNLGVYQKVNDTPAIISFVRYMDEGHQVGRLIFLSFDRKGCIYRSPDGKQHPNPKQHGDMFYNITHEDIRLDTDSSVKPFSNRVFDSEEQAVEELINSAGIQSATYFSTFPTTGDILFALGANFEDDVMNAPIIFDTEGHIWCNGVFNKEGKEVSNKC